nr:protein faf-like, chloroplastic [Quercus suber]
MSEMAKDKGGAPKPLPPLKRSAISLNHKSLQLCTETLGSESDPLPDISAISMNHKSLQLCTETLGSESDPLPDISRTCNIDLKLSETGSYSFSSYPPMETLKQQQGQPQEQDEKVCGAFENKEESRDCIVMGKQSHNACSSKKLSKPRSRSFPPPLPSLSRMELEPRRDNGRFVLQAVSLFPSQNQFQAR